MIAPDEATMEAVDRVVKHLRDRYEGKYHLRCNRDADSVLTVYVDAADDWDLRDYAKPALVDARRSHGVGLILSVQPTRVLKLLDPYPEGLSDL